METKIWSNLEDRSKWGRGPWDDEPDKMQWLDETSGFPCLVNRGAGGAWCGYVGLPPMHPWVVEREWLDLVDVYGGITYGPQACRRHICHEVKGDDVVLWVGFDCAHYLDLAPEDRFSGYSTGTYKTIEFMRDETARLAAQAKKAWDEHLAPLKQSWKELVENHGGEET